jgi:hypothetical protein
VWVLDTETKGTGAEMVPLEKALDRPGRRKEPFFVPPKRRPRTPKDPEPRVPRRFKVLDVMTRRVLAEDADARTTLDLLGGVRSMVDVTVYTRDPAGGWRRLTHAERMMLWEHRAR